MSRFIGSVFFPFMPIYLDFHFGARVAGLLLLINVFIGMGTALLVAFFIDESYATVKTDMKPPQHVRQLILNYGKVIKDKLFVLLPLLVYSFCRWKFNLQTSSVYA
jgi:phosphotransferase system  glucose/maltose/N-acetylglucosamine-specific IIC component